MIFKAFPVKKVMDVFFDPLFLRHDTGFHPENAGRLEMILESLDAAKVKKPRDGEKHLHLAHTAEYIHQVQMLCKLGGSLDADTPVSPETYRAACLAVGAAIDASEKEGFALVRPPGHHAFPDRGSGFCIFNNMAIAALKLAKEGKKIFILDIDVHHGNGTEEIVLDKDNIKFLSTHQSPLYPGTGLSDRGKNVVNVPLPPGTGDREYIHVLEHKVVKEMESFKPDVIGVSVGFDACAHDRGWVAGNAFSLTEKSYTRLKEMLAPYDKFFVLEGGYNPKSILEGAKALMDL